MSNVVPLNLIEPAPRENELLRSLQFSSAGQHLADSAHNGNERDFARQLRRHLRKRFGRDRLDVEQLARHFPGHRAPIEAGSARFDDPGHETFIESSDVELRLVELNLLLELLRRVGARSDRQILWLRWREAWIETARLSEQPPSDERPLVRMLVCEALLASGVLFDGIRGMKRRRKSSYERLFVELDARTDTDGTPHADLMPVLSAWFASLVRCTRWGAVGKVRLGDAEFRERYEGLVRSVSTMIRPDGRIVLVDGDDIRPILAEAFAAPGFKRKSRVARVAARLIGEFGIGPAKAVRQDKESSLPAIQSDWAKLVVSRSSWEPDADLFAMVHHRQLPSIEFRAFGRTVLSGLWGLKIRIDGRELSLPTVCEVVSWFSDKDADYIEIQWPTKQGVVICRQVLLTRRDHQLLLSDCVSTPKNPSSQIEIETTLPLHRDNRPAPPRTDREIRLEASDLPLRVIPAALPMERLQNAAGVLRVEGEQILSSLSALGGVYSPVLLDWHPERSESPADWRTLTVTEDGTRLSQAQAAGCRVRIGKRQLLLYRNLNGSKAARAVLGYHHSCESVIGRFTRSGEVDPLVLIE